MSNPFDTPFVNDVRKFLDEQDNKVSLQVMVNGKVAKYLDYTDNKEDPTVYLFGSGTMRLSQLKTIIKQDIVKFADLVGNKDAKDLLVFMTDFEGKKSSNMYFAYRLYGLMEIEEFLKSPQGKRQVTLIKKK